MRKILSMFIGIATLVSPFTFSATAMAVAPSWNTTGSYVLNMEYLGTDYPYDVNLTQDGLGNLTGDGGSPAGANVYTWVITGGSVVDNTIAFTADYTATPDAVTPLTTVSVEGMIAPDGTMSGTWSDNYDGGDRSGTWTSTSGEVVVIPAVVNLGTAENYVILAKTGVTVTGSTHIVGDIGVSPYAATSLTGLALNLPAASAFSTSALVTGKVYASDYANPTPANLTTAVSNMETAYTTANGLAPNVTELGGGNIGGLTLSPGVYKWTTGVTIPTDVTLSGAADGVWVFQIAENLEISSATDVLLSGGAQASNIFWVVAGQTTIGTTATLNGNVLDQTAIVLNTGATLNGRALAQTEVTMDSNSVSNYFEADSLDGMLNAEDFSVISYDTGLSILSGYTAGFGLTDATFTGASSVVVRLYDAENMLMQTNTAILPAFNADIKGSQFSSSFDVSGTFDYATDEYWTNTREAEYGQSVPATKVVATVTLANGKVITAMNTNLTGDPETIYPVVEQSPTVTVTIEKFVQGSLATAVSADNADFPMTATWDAENIGAGTGSYTLSEMNDIPYQAVTVEMTKGADYETNELVDGDVVGAQCAAGKPFALNGYTTGDTEAEAMAATPSMTAPVFTDLQNNKYVIVWNTDCALPEGEIGGEVVGSDGILAVTSIEMIDISATANGSFEDGWKYVFHITAPTSEQDLAMKFSDWLQTGGGGTIPVANNMRISSLQADNGGATILLTAANVYSTPDLHMTGDLDLEMDGRQVEITIEVAVPSGTPNGAYTTSYGVQSN